MATDLYPRKEHDGSGQWCDVTGGDYGEGTFHGTHASSSVQYVHSCWSERKNVSRADAQVSPASQWFNEDGIPNRRK
jgi:hypothetical protein